VQAEQRGLLTRIPTESGSLCVEEEKVTAFLRLEAAIRVTSLELCFLRNCSQQLNLRRSTPTANSAEPSNSNVEPVSGTEAGCFI
jgi:hypothetical protein